MTNSDLDRAKQLEGILRSSVGQFESGFTDRVMGRIAEEPGRRLDLAAQLSRQFRWLAPIAVAAGIALAVFSAAGAHRSTGQTVAEAVLGLEPATLDGIYTIEIPLSGGVTR